MTFTPGNWQAVSEKTYTTADDSATGSNQTLTAPTTDLVRLTNGSLVSIDMIPSGTTGSPFWLINDTGGAVTISNETGATAAQRIKTGTGASLSLADQASLQVIYDSTDSRWQIVGGSSGSGGGSDIEVAILKEESNSNLASSANTVQTRNLNSSYGDTGIIVSLSSSQFTLDPGTYFCDYIAYSYRSAYSTLFLYNVTDSVYVSTTQPNTYNWPSTNIFIPTHGSDHFTIVSQKTYELRHYTDAGDADGLGNSGYLSTNNPASINVYAYVKVMKIG